ncbi:MAG: hypothetical protein IPK80_34930 [Nannocystis sp.]|nr:hypothetical protein [Nannocystis sp.]
MTVEILQELVGLAVQDPDDAIADEGDAGLVGREEPVPCPRVLIVRLVAAEEAAGVRLPNIGAQAVVCRHQASAVRREGEPSYDA